MRLWMRLMGRTVVVVALLVAGVVLVGGCTIAETHEPAVAAEGPTPTSSRMLRTWPGMNPTRRAAVEQRNQTRNQTIVAMLTATPPRPAQTRTPAAETPFVDPLLVPGIHPDCFGEKITTSVILGPTQNCWTGFVADTYFFVRAGAAVSDAQQGRILVAVFAEDRSGVIKDFYYDTPTLQGAVAVASYAEPHLTFRAGDGTTFVFDLARRTWDTSDQTAVPLFATPDTLPVPSPLATPPAQLARAADRVLFASWRTPRQNIYLLEGFDTEPVHLVDSSAREMSPVWSPDGGLVAFISDRYGGPEILVLNVVTEDMQRLTYTQWFKYNLAWSPDGTRIAFDSVVDLHTIDQEGTLTTLTQNPRDGSIKDNDPSWSPDSTRIAFTSTRDGNKEIYVMQADGSNPVRLTTDPADDVEAAWSPDGTRIAFTSTRDGNEELYVMQADGTNPVRLTTHPADDVEAAWSPDGTRIAFTSTRDGNEEIYVMQADGSNPVRLTTHPEVDRQPAWAP